MSYTCAICGRIHDDLPDIGIDRPDIWWDIAESERERRVKLTEDTCVVDSEHYFVRGVIQIPLIGRQDHFGFGVWVSHKKENFEAYVANPDSDQIGPFFGWLCTRISYYPATTLHLKARAHYRSGGLRPLIEMERTEHPLAVDQRDGISLSKAWAIVHHYSDKTPPAV